MKAGPAKQNLGLEAPVLTVPGEELAIFRQIGLGDRVPSSRPSPVLSLRLRSLRQVAQPKRKEIPLTPKPVDSLI